MRRRITYIHKNSNPVKSVSRTRLELEPEGDYIQEQRLIGSFGDEYSHIKDLRVQISTDDDRSSFPFSYVFGLGLHVYAVPQGLRVSDDKDTFYDQLERILYELLGIEISSEAFILAYNSFYYHSNATDFPGAFSGLRMPQNWSKIDYFRSEDEFTLKWLSYTPETVISDPPHRTEVGVFSVLDHSEPDDVILSGGRLIMGDETQKSDKLTKTLFHIKPRHRKLQAQALSKIVENGLHPVLSVNAYVQEPTDSDVSNCQLYTYMTLEKSVFLDPYQMPAQLSLVANYGPKNLELPEYSVPQWGNELLFEPKKEFLKSDTKVKHLNFDMTLHSRYQLPKEEAMTHVTIDKPSVFYACEILEDALSLKQSPFDNFHYLGGTYEKFFTENSVFYHVQDAGQLSVAIPNAMQDSSRANGVTFAALFLGCFLVVQGLLNRFQTKKTSHAKKVE